MDNKHTKNYVKIAHDRREKKTKKGVNITHEQVSDTYVEGTIDGKNK